jgi:hypothetical protein
MLLRLIITPIFLFSVFVQNANADNSVINSKTDNSLISPDQVIESQAIYKLFEDIGIKTYQKNRANNDHLKAICIAREFLGLKMSRKDILVSEYSIFQSLSKDINKPKNAIEGVNFNIKCQMGYVVEKNKVIKIFEITSGENDSTPRGIYKAQRKTDGWRKSTLYDVNLYKPININGAIAIHGVPSPAMITYIPASHGCLRVPNHIMDYLYKKIKVGDKVRVYQSW